MCLLTCLFAEIETDQEANNPCDHEGESGEIKFTDVFSEALSLVRVEVEEEEQKEAGDSTGWPGAPSMNLWMNMKYRTHRLTKKHHLQET